MLSVLDKPKYRVYNVAKRSKGALCEDFPYIRRLFFFLQLRLLKGGIYMNDLSEKLMERLNSAEAFRLPIGSGIPISMSLAVSWGIILFLVIVSIWLTHNMKLVPDRKQAAVEMAVEWIYKFFTNLLGEEGKAYIPYLGTVLLYIGLANLCGLVGITPPTKELNITAGLAIMSIVLIEAAGIRAKGTKRWLKSFAEPVAFVLPINILEVFIRPLSLCMRLFGNILGGFVVMELIKLVAPALVPLPFSFYFDIFDGCIQAYVFVFLTSLFIKEAID